jgi:hypothetical protein
MMTTQLPTTRRGACEDATPGDEGSVVVVATESRHWFEDGVAPLKRNQDEIAVDFHSAWITTICDSCDAWADAEEARRTSGQQVKTCLFPRKMENAFGCSCHSHNYDYGQGFHCLFFRRCSRSSLAPILATRTGR